MKVPSSNTLLRYLTESVGTNLFRSSLNFMLSSDIFFTYVEGQFVGLQPLSYFFQFIINFSARARNVLDSRIFVSSAK